MLRIFLNAFLIPDTYVAKVARIGKLWTFWPVNVTALFPFMERWAKWLFVGFKKNGLLTEGCG